MREILCIRIPRRWVRVFSQGQIDCLFRLITKNRSIARASNAGGWINIKIQSYQYMKSHCGDKTILRPCYLHNGISWDTGKMTSLYWTRALDAFPCHRVIMCGTRKIDQRPHALQWRHNGRDGVSNHQFTEPFIQVQIKESIKGPRHWPSCPRWIPRTKGQWRGKCFHLMTSSCEGWMEI